MTANLVLLALFSAILWCVFAVSFAWTRGWQQAGLAFLTGFFTLFFGALLLLRWLGH